MEDEPTQNISKPCRVFCLEGLGWCHWLFNCLGTVVRVKSNRHESFCQKSSVSGRTRNFLREEFK